MTCRGQIGSRVTAKLDELKLSDRVLMTAREPLMRAMAADADLSHRRLLAESMISARAVRSQIDSKAAQRMKAAIAAAERSERVIIGLGRSAAIAAAERTDRMFALGRAATALERPERILDRLVGEQTYMPVMEQMRADMTERQRVRREMLAAVPRTNSASVVAAVQERVVACEQWRDVLGNVAEGLVEAIPDTANVSPEEVEEVSDPKVEQTLLWLPPLAQATLAASQGHYVRSSMYLGGPMRDRATTKTLLKVGAGLIAIVTVCENAEKAWEWGVWSYNTVMRFIK